VGLKYSKIPVSLQVRPKFEMKRLLSYILFSTLISSLRAQQLSVINARCENRNNPLGVDVPKPNLSWELQSTQRNIIQTAYRIIVSDDSMLLKNNTGNIWDSKKINSNTSIQVSYNGKALLSAKKYFWKVMLWDNKGTVSSWSNAAMWQMGLLNKNDWSNAKWIGYDEINDTAIIVPHVHQSGKKAWGPRKDILPLLRKSFSINKQIKTATAFICGLGHFELSINGKKTGDHFLDPGWTNYAKHAQYITFDISNELQQGTNAIGVMLGNGFYYIPGQRYRKMTGGYGFPKMIMRTVIEYMDGTIENIVTDQSWSTAPSPIIFSSIFGGEDYDASLERKNWNTANFNDADWKKAIVTTGPPLLESQMAEPLKVMEEFKPVKETKLPDGSTVYDLAQNFSGIPFITVSGSKGDTVKIIPAELINEDGTANQKATGSPSYFTYVLKGDADESWQPRFMYYGFRYLQVYCIAKDSATMPIVKNIKGLHTRNAAAQVGTFSSSNELFNKTYTLINWAIKSNTVSVFTDCPHREKLGWLEQTHLMGASIQYNYDIASLCKKVIKDMMNAQYANGLIPEIAPEFTKFGTPFDESPEWGSAAIILPWYNYQWYGDKQTLSDAYSMMKGYVMYLKNYKDTNNILTHGLGDWFDIGPNKSGFSQMTKMGITATATYYYNLTMMIDIAKLLNKTSDVKLFQQWAIAVRKSFNDHFFNKQKLQYDSASQTANAMALYMRLVEPQYKNAVVNALVKDIQSRNNALTAGDIGYRYVLRALENADRSDVIFNMNSRNDVPGYGFQLKQGATALTESWQAYPSVSNNHLMLGHLMEWFYAGLCGIKQANNSVAYNKIEIRPQPVGDVTHAAATYHSPYGEIKTDWKIIDNNFELNVTIPANSTAIIYLPRNKNGIKVGSGKHSYKMKIN